MLRCRRWPESRDVVCLSRWRSVSLVEDRAFRPRRATRLRRRTPEVETRGRPTTLASARHRHRPPEKNADVPASPARSRGASAGTVTPSARPTGNGCGKTGRTPNVPWSCQRCGGSPVVPGRVAASTTSTSAAVRRYSMCPASALTLLGTFHATIYRRCASAPRSGRQRSAVCTPQIARGLRSRSVANPQRDGRSLS